MKPWSPPPRRGRFLKPHARSAVIAFAIIVPLVLLALWVGVQIGRG